MFGWFRKAQQVSTASFDTMDHNWIRRAFGGPTNSGKSITEDNALRIATAWACQRIIAETIGSIPRAMYTKDASGNAQEADNHPLSTLFRFSPNADQDGVQFFEDISLGLCGRGNAYCYVSRLGGQVISLTPIYDEVKPMRKRANNTRLAIPENTVFYRVFAQGGVYTDYLRQDIWQVKGFGKGLEGLSPVSAAKEAMGSALAAEEFGARFFSQGGLPSGTVTVPNWLDKKQREIARENLQQLLGGLGNAHKFALMEGGMKPEPWGQVNLEDMQFILVRKFSVTEICRFYRIPPHMVADLDRATFSNIEQLSQEFVTYTLMPYLTRIESAVARWLLKPEEWGKVFLRFNFEGLLRADSAGRATFYSQALQNGWMNRNEVRAKENLNKVEGLDEFTAQTNLAPVDQLGNEAFRTASPNVVRAPNANPNPDQQPKSTVSVILPNSMKYEVEAGGMKHALNEFSVGVKLLVDRLESGQRALAAEVAKGNEQIAQRVEEGSTALAKRIEEGHSTIMSGVVSAHEAVVEGHDKLSAALKAKRRIRVGDEVFESESM